MSLNQSSWGMQGRELTQELLVPAAMGLCMLLQHTVCESVALNGNILAMLCISGKLRWYQAYMLEDPTTASIW